MVDAKRRGRPTGPRSDESRLLILATAQRLFGESGYGGVAMERIAQASGRTVRAVYHYFPSKRALFQAATQQALERFGQEVQARVFVHDHVEDRIRGYLTVYRGLHSSDPHVVPFIGMVLVDAIAAPDPDADPDLVKAAEALRAFLGVLVDDAIARGEVHPSVDREGTITMLAMLGRGLSLTALSDADSFAPMLDALELLLDGALFTPRPE